MTERNGLICERGLIVLAPPSTRGHPGLPHVRLELTVVDAKRCYPAMNASTGEAPAATQAARVKSVQFGRTMGGVGVRRVAIQLIGRFGPTTSEQQADRCKNGANSFALPWTALQLRCWSHVASSCVRYSVPTTLPLNSPCAHFLQNFSRMLAPVSVVKSARAGTKQ